MSIEGCPHGPIIGDLVCVECSRSRETKDPRVAKIEEQMEAVAKKLANTCPSCAAKETRIKELEDKIAFYKGEDLANKFSTDENAALAMEYRRQLAEEHVHLSTAERELSESRDACNGLHDMVKGYEADLRSIAGALGEFYGPDAAPLVEKIYAIRKERDEKEAELKIWADKCVDARLKAADQDARRIFAERERDGAKCENSILEKIARDTLGTLFAETYLTELRRRAGKEEPK